MEMLDAAEKILLTMLEKLGFNVEVEREQTDTGAVLNLVTNEGAHLIGKNGDRLDDIQYLLNRTLNRHYPDAERIRVDCDHYRRDQETRLIETARNIAQQVVADGRSRKLKPLNAYYRRIAYNSLLEIEGVEATSPDGKSRYKRIQIAKAN